MDYPHFKKSSLTDSSSSSEDESTMRGGLGSSSSNIMKTSNPPGYGFMSSSSQQFQKKAFTSSLEDDDDEEDEDEDEPPQKKKKTDSNVKNSSLGSSKPSAISNVANRMMERMGYKEGTGLGKFGQGIKDIVEVPKQRGRRGLGLHLEGPGTTDVVWETEKEEISVTEEIKWMPECNEYPPKMSELRPWMKEGPKKMTINDETEFCEPTVLSNILACKSVFDNLEGEELRRARTRANPFELIGKMIFQNRAAMKMANMDYAFDFMFTNPVDENGQPMVSSQELLYFADVCAGPGGFSEYVLWRKGWEAKGFGFTLKGPHDFKLEEFFAGPPETFEPHYGVNGVDGDGNVFVPENLRAFRKFVLDNTDNKGVHFVMADGGFSVEGQENIQEILSKQLYLCQFLCALSILRIGGHFVCKLFDIFTPFSIGLIYLMYRAFKKVCIFKPNTSRPANSERYIVCKWRRENTKDVHDYMFEVNCTLYKLSGVTSTSDVREIVPLVILKEDQKFCEYIIESNNSLGRKQVIHLAKIKAFADDPDLNETENQIEIMKQCLELWKVPHKARSAPNRPEPFIKFKELMRGQNLDYLSYKAEELTPSVLESIKSVYDYRCMVSATDKDNRGDRCFILGVGRTNVFRWDGTVGSKWTKLEPSTLELPASTLLYVEMVQELKGQGRAQRKIMAIHILDALYLGGKDVRDVPFIERMNMAEKLAKAVSKPSRPDSTPIRVKKIYRLENIDQVFDRLDMKEVKGGIRHPRLCYEMEDLAEERHFLPSGLLFIKIVEDPWTIGCSRSSKRKYYFNTKTGESVFEIRKDAIAGFKSCFAKRIFWSWERGVKLLDGHPMEENKVHRHTVVHFVNRHLQR